MPITPRERLARVLDGSQVPGAFSAQLSVPARDVRLMVAGAGPISLPVKALQAKQMIACARPARFGRGEHTLMDLGVSAKERGQFGHNVSYANTAVA